MIVDKRPTLGGVCLNIGCIPSKALLHVAKTIDEAAAMAAHGVAFGPPTLDLTAIRDWKDSVVKRLTTGLTGLARQRKVTVVSGNGRVHLAQHAGVETAEGPRTVRFAKAIVAAGSEPVAPGFIPTDPRIWDSTACARTALSAEPTAGARRRHHRARNGDRLSGARARSRSSK